MGVTLRMRISGSCYSLNNGDGAWGQRMGTSLNLAAGKVQDLASHILCTPKLLPRPLRIADCPILATVPRDNVFGAYEACIDV